jgi:hypothetical protein
MKKTAASASWKTTKTWPSSEGLFFCALKLGADVPQQEVRMKTSDPAAKGVYSNRFSARRGGPVPKHPLFRPNSIAVAT